VGVVVVLNLTSENIAIFSHLEVHTNIDIEFELRNFWVKAISTELGLWTCAVLNLEL
jgi:hypothetical protein